MPRGSVYGFLGPNAAGKTTTIRLLLGLIRPDSGTIDAFGEPLQGTNRRRFLARTGAMVEAPGLYPHLTGNENLRVIQGLLGLSRSCIDRVLRIVRLEGDDHRLVRTYSQGMRQRLGIASALLAQPDLLILDEPTNGLDPAGIHEFRELIRAFPNEHGITVLLSSHLLAEVEQMATHVGVIGRGRLLFEGTLGDLRRRWPERVVIDVDRPAAAASLLHDAGWTVHYNEVSGITLDRPQRADVARVAATLIGHGINLYQLRATQPSLEDLFLDLTRGEDLTSVPSKDSTN